MKIKVKPEGRKDMFIPNKKSLEGWIIGQKFGQIHNFIPNGMMMLGADHSVEDVLEDIEKGERLAILTGQAKANNVGHALAIITNNKLEMYDIGDITEKDLQIQKQKEFKII